MQTDSVYATAQQRLAGQIPSPRDGAAWRTAERSRADHVAEQQQLAARLQEARDARRAAELHLSMLGDGASLVVRGDRLRQLQAALEQERLAGEAIAAYQAPDESAERKAVALVLQQTAEQLARVNQECGERVLAVLKKALPDIAKMNAAARLRDGYFDVYAKTPFGEPLDTADTPRGGFPPLDAAALRALDIWLRRAEGEVIPEGYL